MELLTRQMIVLVCKEKAGEARGDGEGKMGEGGGGRRKGVENK